MTKYRTGINNVSQKLKPSTHKIYNESVYFVRPGKRGVFVPITRSMKLRYKHRGPPFGFTHGSW